MAEKGLEEAGLGEEQQGWDKHPEDKLAACENDREAISDTTESYCRSSRKGFDFLGVGTHPCGLHTRYRKGRR